MRKITWSPVLAALPTSELRRLFACSATRKLGRGAYLAVTGEPARSVHLVENGLVKLMAADSRGAEVTLALLTEGDLVGELAVVGETTQETDALALTALRVRSFDAESFTEVVTRSRSATLELARAAARRSRALTRLTLENAAAPVGQRLAGRILDLAEVLGTRKGRTIEMEMPLNQRDLGSLAGMSRETACKTMRRFRDKGLLDYRGRRMKILRPDLLEHLRCGGTRSTVTTEARASTPFR